MPRCRYCQQTYKPARSMQPGRVCNSLECMAKYADETIKNQRQKKAKSEMIAAREDRKVIRMRLAKLRPGYLEAKAQEAINAYVRVRDHEEGCISCDKPATWDGQWQAGHLKTRGANSFLRYSLWNLNKQCSPCNLHASGNVAEHERGIIRRYGIERIEYLHSAPKSRRYDDEYLIRLARIFRKKTRILKKRKGIE